MDFKQVSDHSWYAHSRLYEYNSGIIESDGLVWLIDPGMTPDEVFHIREFCTKQGWEIQAVLITHFHYDHVLGVNAFDDAIRVTHGRFEAEYTRMKQRNQAAIDRLVAGGDMNLPPWGWDVTSDWQINRTQSFLINDLEVLVIPLPGHTADQIGVFIPRDGSLFAADTLSDLEIPFLSFDALAYQKSLEKLRRYTLERIVPGHGCPSLGAVESRERIQRDLEYIRVLRRMVKRLLGGGASLEQVREACADIPIILPDDNFGPHTWNIESIFLEMGGDAGEEKIGWEREWD